MKLFDFDFTFEWTVTFPDFFKRNKIKEDPKKVQKKKELDLFLKEWIEDYKKLSGKIPLFLEKNQESFISLSDTQKRLFLRLLYHARGHFPQFLFTVANSAPHIKYKRVILDNIRDGIGCGLGRYGGTLHSHEALYLSFASDCEVSLDRERIVCEYYKPFLQEFNGKHMEWLLSHDFTYMWSAFSAYELLDNVDYENLRRVAKSMFRYRAVKMDFYEFFDAHLEGDHYEQTKNLLEEVWLEDEEAVREGFKFIAEHQLAMWEELSRQVLECKEKL